ncbi:DNA adenine methylase [Baaleninema sp.]|uniref:DNA adenine methylase n=1 Tax=Baaleninema sp. TaxID=3101197 RepID=UPI003D0513FC
MSRSSLKTYNNPKSLKPPLKWAGGKRWLVKYLQPWWETHQDKRLVEPFCGGLAVTLGLSPQQALLNDINPHLINFYTWVQKGLKLEIPTCNDSEVYYQHRERFNELIEQNAYHQKEAAEIFYYLNRSGFNGLCRFNKKGKFNVPFGRYKTINYIADFKDYQELFENWEFKNLDFEELDIEDSDFIYADPPYDVDFRQYSKDGFDWEDQVRLANWLADRSNPVVTSNQATARIVELYRNLGFEIKTIDAPRFISCNGDRTPAKEILAFKRL